MKLLKILGWIFVPYILIFIFWKKTIVTLRVIACIWAAFVVLATIGSVTGQNDKPMIQTASISVSPKITETTKFQLYLQNHI